MRLTSITAKNLFGHFNHHVDLNLTERITIVHGPNGFGKTALLRIIDAFINGRFTPLRRIPFDEVMISFDNGDCVKITKEQSDRRPTGSPIIVFTLLRNEKKPDVYKHSENNDPRQRHYLSSYISNELPHLHRIRPGEWLDVNSHELLSLEEVVDRYEHILPPGTRPSKVPEWLTHIRSSIDVRFIETQRLHSPASRESNRSNSMEFAVDKFSSDITRKVEAKLAESVALSQALDRTFPVRLVEKVSQNTPADITDDELRNKLANLEERRSQLKDAGLLNKDEDAGFQVFQQIDDKTKSVLSVYIDDVKAKLDVFNDIAAKIELFKNILNERFAYKTVSISKGDGFVITSQTGRKILPSSLSSGEQHELILLYELLFNIKPDSLVLIDEPEISLHVAWQVQFLNDFAKITTLADFDVLIATHSPQIISDRWDLTVELRGS